MYVSDHERYPYALRILDNAAATLDWDQLLEPYTGQNWTNALYKCPSFKRRTKGRVFLGNGWSNPEGSYAYNAWGTGNSGTRPHLGLGSVIDAQGSMLKGGSRSESDIRVATEMIAIGDGGGFDNDYSVQARPIPRAAPLARHWPGLNLVFCDGHIEFVRLDRLFERTETARRRWNFDNEPHPETWEPP